jgi:hypothetical protein
MIRKTKSDYKVASESDQPSQVTASRTYPNFNLAFRLPFLISESPAPSGVVRYVSPDGSDSNSGTSLDFPWKTVGKVNSTALGSDSMVLFKAGGRWYRSTLAPLGNGLNFGRYGTGPNPLITAADNLKAVSWINEGSGVWSTLVTRSIGSGTGSSRRTKLLRATQAGPSWFCDDNMKLDVASLQVNGDWFHIAGKGPQKLYIFNSAGNPASDSGLVRVEYGLGVFACDLKGRKNITIDSIDFEGSAGDAGIRIENADNITLTNVRFEGHRGNGIRGRYDGHVTLNQCRGNHCGVQGDQTGQIIHVGGEGVANVMLRALEINGGSYGPYSGGGDVVTNNGGSAMADGTISRIIARDAYFECHIGENPWDSKCGHIELYRCELYGRGNGRGVYAITIQNFTASYVLEDNLIHSGFAAALSLSSNSKSPDAIVRGRALRNTFRNETANTSARRETVHWQATTDSDQQFEGNKLYGAEFAQGGSVMTIENGVNSRVRGNTFVRRGNIAHLRITQSGLNANLGPPYNTTPDAGGLVIVGA